MIAKHLIEQIADLKMRLDQEELSNKEINTLNTYSIEKLEEEKNNLLGQLYAYPEFYEYY